jgi:hypothetical protein
VQISKIKELEEEYFRTMPTNPSIEEMTCVEMISGTPITDPLVNARQAYKWASWVMKINYPGCRQHAMTLIKQALYFNKNPDFQLFAMYRLLCL